MHLKFQISKRTIKEKILSAALYLAGTIVQSLYIGFKRNSSEAIALRGKGVQDGECILSNAFVSFYEQGSEAELNLVRYCDIIRLDSFGRSLYFISKAGKEMKFYSIPSSAFQNRQAYLEARKFLNTAIITQQSEADQPVLGSFLSAIAECILEYLRLCAKMLAIVLLIGGAFLLFMFIAVTIKSIMPVS